MKITYILFTLLISLNGSFSYADGDVKNGGQLYATHCSACHSIEVSLAGPSHCGVFGRKAGSVADFDYSPALKNSKVVWNEKTLELWLMNPEKLIPGQQMGYSVSSDEERKDLIAFLKKQIKR